MTEGRSVVASVGEEEHEEIGGEKQVHYFHCADGFMDIYICHTLSIKYFKYIQLPYQIYLNKTFKKS